MKHPSFQYSNKIDNKADRKDDHAVISIAEKRKFISWFLNQYELRRETAWLLRFLSSRDQLLKRIHFVDHVNSYPRAMIISTCCSKMVPFRYMHHQRISMDVETAFYDIQMYPDEELYIGLYFRDRSTCPEYAAIMEGNPMEKYDLAQDQLLSLFAEMILDQALRDFQRRELYKKIDDALASRDEQSFLQLSEQWKKILEIS